MYVGKDGLWTGQCFHFFKCVCALPHFHSVHAYVNSVIQHNSHCSTVVLHGDWKIRPDRSGHIYFACQLMCRTKNRIPFQCSFFFALTQVRLKLASINCFHGNFSASTCDHIELPGIVYWPDGQVRLGVTAMKNDQSPKNKYIEEWRP